MRSHLLGRAGRRAPTWTALVAACHPEPTAAVTAVTTALAIAAGRSAAGGVAVAGAVLAGQLSVGWSNDWIDADRDRAVDRRDKPVVTGRIAPDTLRRAATGALVGALLLSMLSGWRAALAHAAAIGLAWSYNLGVKSGWASPLPYATAFGLLPVFVTLGLPGHPLPPWWAVVAGMLLGAGAHFANVLPDLDDDAATGVRGLPQRLGAVATRWTAATLLLLATGVLTVGPGRPSPGVVAALVAVTLLVAVGVRRGGRSAFRVVLVVAAVDVGVLLSRGGALT